MYGTHTAPCCRVLPEAPKIVRLHHGHERKVMFDYIGGGILLVLLLIFGALTVRGLRARRVRVKLVGGVPAGLLTPGMGPAASMALVGFAKINAQHSNPCVK